MNSLRNQQKIQNSKIDIAITILCVGKIVFVISLNINFFQMSFKVEHTYREVHGLPIVQFKGTLQNDRLDNPDEDKEYHHYPRIFISFFPSYL